MTYRSDSMYKSCVVIYQLVFCKNDFATSEIVLNISKICLGFMETCKISINGVNINFARIVSEKRVIRKQFYRFNYKIPKTPEKQQS